MRSIKRGRSQSIMSGVIGLIMSIGFFAMAGMVSQYFGAMAFMPALMGIVVVISSIYSIVSGTRKNRFSELDITDGEEEPDPLNRYFGGAHDEPERGHTSHAAPFADGESMPADAGMDAGGYAVDSHDADNPAHAHSSSGTGRSAAYCPYCGARVQGDYAFCASCGCKLPDKV